MAGRKYSNQGNLSRDKSVGLRAVVGNKAIAKANAREGSAVGRVVNKAQAAVPNQKGAATKKTLAYNKRMKTKKALSQGSGGRSI